MSNTTHADAYCYSISEAARDEVREFARRFPTPNVLLLLEHCEAGRITWAAAHRLAADALSRATR